MPYKFVTRLRDTFQDIMQHFNLAIIKDYTFLHFFRLMLPVVFLDVQYSPVKT